MGDRRRSTGTCRRSGWAPLAAIAFVFSILGVGAPVGTFDVAGAALVGADDANPPDASGGAIADVTAEVFPGTVVLAAGERADVAVVVTNPTDRMLTIESVSAAVSPGLRVADLPSMPVSLEPHTAQQLAFNVTAERRFETGSVNLLLTSSLPRPFNARQVALVDERVLTPALTVTASNVQPDITVEIVSAPAALVDGEHADLVAVIENTSPFTVSDVEVTALQGRDVAVGSPGCSETDDGCAESRIEPIDTIAPGDVEKVELEVAAEDRVHTGKQKVGVLVRGVVALADGSDVDPLVLAASATTEVEVTVFGINAVTPIGAATLLLVPGVAAVLTFVLLRRIRPRGTAVTADLKDSAVLFVAAVVGALSYYVAWDWWGVDLARGGVGTADVVLLVLAGVGIGAVAYVVYLGVYEWTIGRKQFATGDDCVAALERLKARGVGLTLPKHTTGFVLGRNVDGQYALSPGITFANVADDDATRRAINKALGDEDLGAVVRHARDGGLHLEWTSVPGVSLSKDAPAGEPTRAPLLEEEAE